ncbi:MAG: PadR family transcriptional regulator [Candidatus Saccharimonadales bacterium]
MSRRTTNLLPQISFSVLLALSLKPRHGYELMKQIEQDSTGLVKIGPGALYGTIKQLHEEGLIEELADSDNGRRRYYRLTSEGKKRLGAELSYFESTVKLAQQRRLLNEAIAGAI